MATFSRITKRDDPKEIATTAARYQALLTEALAMAKRKADGKPQIVRDILATGTAEGLSTKQNAKYAVVTYHAKTYKRTWLSLIGWQYLQNSSAEEWANSMIETVEANVQLTETDSCPKTRSPRSRPKRRK